jgi:hypothetical protein
VNPPLYSLIDSIIIASTTYKPKTLITKLTTLFDPKICRMCMWNLHVQLKLLTVLNTFKELVVIAIRKM